jgi:hypothetical protein
MGPIVQPTVLSTVTMVGNATMETKVCSLLYLKNANITVLLNNVRKGVD